MLPDSIRAQTTWTLALGLVCVLLVGVLVAGASMSEDEAGPADGFETAIVALAVAADELPQAADSTLPEAARAAGLFMRPAGASRLHPDPYTDALANRVGSTLAPRGMIIEVAGHEPGDDPRGAARFWSHAGDIVMRVRLSDGRLVEFVRPGHWSLTQFLGQVAPVIAVLGAGLVVLSVWVAWRVTAPLQRFADGAERLGRDIRSAPLDERGPREIRRAARVLNATQQCIQRLVEDRTLMLGAIAHDLRTPLMRLHLRAELMPDEAQRHQMAADLAEMEQMIRTALTFAREETVVEPHEPVDLLALSREVCRELEEDGHDVELTHGAAATVDGSPMSLKRALRNLMHNAARYGCRARVQLAARPGAVDVIIDDDGPGIPEEQHEQVFAPFYRLERSRSREGGGSGLGMTIARTAVRAHGGDIVLSNRSDGGLRQVVTLPRAGQ
jgi:signal transduction histidine kinase